MLIRLVATAQAYALHVSGYERLAHKSFQRRLHKGKAAGREWEIGTEVSMLSGISRKRSIRSNPYWFTEFCNSQCISHFAAPFIVVRAETSVAESCKTNLGMTDRAAKEKIREKHKEWFKRQGATTGRGVEDGPSLPAALEFPTRGIAAQKRTTPSLARASHGSVHGDSRVDIACE